MELSPNLISNILKFIIDDVYMIEGKKRKPGKGKLEGEPEKKRKKILEEKKKPKPKKRKPKPKKKKPKPKKKPNWIQPDWLYELDDLYISYLTSESKKSEKINLDIPFFDNFSVYFNLEDHYGEEYVFLTIPTVEVYPIYRGQGHFTRAFANVEKWVEQSVKLVKGDNEDKIVIGIKFERVIPELIKGYGLSKFLEKNGYSPDVGDYYKLFDYL